MKTLEEKKLLAQMSRAFGQPDPELEESIRREELLNEKLFAIKKPVEPRIEILKEQVLTEVEKPAETNLIPAKSDLIQQTVNSLSDPKFVKSNLPDFQKKELDGLRKQIADIIQKMGTLSWGGGGTGVVRINDTDDFDRGSYSEGRYLRWSNGMFRLDEINTQQVVYNTTLVTSATYTVADEDYYIGVNYAGPVTITVPATTASGRHIIIKDESGNCDVNNITIAGTIDNDAGGCILQIQNGAIDLLFRNGWRII